MVLWLGVALCLLSALTRWMPRRRRPAGAHAAGEGATALLPADSPSELRGSLLRSPSTLGRGTLAAAPARAAAAAAALLLLLAAGEAPLPAGSGAVAARTPPDPGPGAPRAVVEQAALPPPAPAAVGVRLTRPQPPRPAMEAAAGGPAVASAPEGAPVAAPVDLDAPEPETRSAGGMELRIPRLWLRAPIVDLGRAASGELEVPSDGATVGWYEMTALPGDPGQALLGGHFDWEGSLAVFASLSELRAGDRIELVRTAGEDPLVYAVDSLVSVDPDRTLAEVLDGGEGSTLVLITCGGDFDVLRGGYASRLLVRATLLEESAPPRGS